VNFGRNPILLIIALFFLLFIVLSVINRKSSTSLNDNDRALRTNQTLTRIVDAESKYLAANGKYSGHVADLVPLSKKLAIDLTDGVATIQLDSSGDKAYVVQVTSTVLTFTRAFDNGKLVAKSCLQLKSAGKKYCTRTTSDVKKSVPDTAPAT
jgi:hypothetical protein